jgi:hypothetical protein
MRGTHQASRSSRQHHFLLVAALLLSSGRAVEGDGIGNVRAASEMPKQKLLRGERRLLLNHHPHRKLPKRKHGMLFC